MYLYGFKLIHTKNICPGAFVQGKSDRLLLQLPFEIFNEIFVFVTKNWPLKRGLLASLPGKFDGSFN